MADMFGEGFFDFPPACEEHWVGMPSFNQVDLTPHQSIVVHLRSPNDRRLLSDLLGRNLTEKTRSIWYPREEIGRLADKRFVSDEPLNPRHPVYVISKGRWESRLTVRALEEMGVPHRVVIEPQELDEYASVIDRDRLLILPFSNLGKGSIPARNWVWEHSLKEGHRRHWILDDNINGFFRLANNLKTPVKCGNVFRAAEDFVDRYDNVALAGFNYFMFASRKTVFPPFYLNTRVYSCILIRNDLPHRWRGRYNEDTDLSLRVLKDGWCTVLFNAFLAFKMTTMTMKGGNTDDLYQGDGRRKMAESLKEQHPDVVEIVRKWGRWQHSVDYGRFRRNRLKLRKDALIEGDVNDYGMHLERVEECRKLLMVGQAPGQCGDPSEPLAGKIGRRLSKLAGLEYEDYLERTDRMNLFDSWPGKDGKGDAWDAKQAVKRAGELLPQLMGRRVLFVGKNVAAAFGMGDVPWLTWMEVPFSAKVAAIPHPSGIVLWWNEAENKKAAGEFLAEAFMLGEVAD